MIDSKTKLLAILATMRPGPIHWSQAHIDMYDLGLVKLPDAACQSVAQAVLAKFDSRPSAKEVMELYAELCAESDAQSITEILGELWRLVRKYGEHGAPHRSFPDQWPLIADEGPPPELHRMADAVGKAIAAFGGWVEFARNFDWSDGTDRAQFRDMLKAATLSHSDSELRDIRLSYRAKNLTQRMNRRELSDVSESAEITRDEAAMILGKIGQIGKTL